MNDDETDLRFLPFEEGIQIVDLKTGVGVMVKCLVSPQNYNLSNSEVKGKFEQFPYWKMEDLPLVHGVDVFDREKIRKILEQGRQEHARQQPLTQKEKEEEKRKNVEAIERYERNRKTKNHVVDTLFSEWQAERAAGRDYQSLRT